MRWCRTAAMLAIAFSNACLELNPAYVDGGSGGGTAADEAAVTEAATSDAASSSSSGEPACDPGGTTSGTIDEPVDISGMSSIVGELADPGVEADWYKAYVDPMTPAHLFALTPDADVAVCVYVECNGGDPAEITKCGDGPMDTADHGYSGCCGRSETRVNYLCQGGAQFDVMAWVRVEDSVEPCVTYNLQTGFDDPL